MSPHPISPLAKSQTNLDLVEHASQRQALLPLPTIPIHHEDSACTLQVSRRPSLLLQEILRKDGFLSPRSAKNGYFFGLSTGVFFKASSLQQ